MSKPPSVKHGIFLTYRFNYTLLWGNYKYYFKNRPFIPGNKKSGPTRLKFHNEKGNRTKSHSAFTTVSYFNSSKFISTPHRFLAPTTD